MADLSDVVQETLESAPDARRYAHLVSAFSKHLTLVAVFVSVLVAPGCAVKGARPAAAADRTPAAWDAFVADFLQSYFVAHPEAAISAGRHEFDGHLSDWSAAGIRKEIARLKRERERALAFQDEGLGARERFERDYMVSEIGKMLFWLETAELPFRNPTFYSGSLDPNVYLSRDYAPLADRMRAYVGYAKAIPAAAAQIRANLRVPLPRTFVKVGRLSFGGLASYYEKDVPTAFASVQDEALRAEFETANRGAIGAMKALDSWLGEQEATANDAFALGSARFTEMLKSTEGVTTPLAELQATGERDLARNLAELGEACALLAPGEPIEACVTKAKQNKPEGSPVEAARLQLAGLRAFVDQNDIVTVPGSEQALVRESPPYQRWNFAYIDIPGPYEKNQPSTYYIAPPDPTWSEADQKAYLPGRSDLLFVSVHEVWPGHFLQFLHANRAPSKFGQVFVGYAFAEGWAHYTEEMMWDAGLGKGDPETHIGQLLNALLRNVRFLSAIGLHTGGMTVEQSEQMFREKAHQDAGNARQQAARGTFDPAYLNYTMGKLMIRKLRQDWTATRGGRKAWRAFHDEFLKYGGPQIPLVRKAMMGGETTGSLF